MHLRNEVAFNRHNQVEKRECENLGLIFVHRKRWNLGKRQNLFESKKSADSAEKFEKLDKNNSADSAE